MVKMMTKELTQIQKDALIKRLRDIQEDACEKVPRYNLWTGQRFMFTLTELQALMHKTSLATADFLLEIKQEEEGNG